MRYWREPPATLYQGQHWLIVFITYSLLHLALSTPLIPTSHPRPLHKHAPYAVKNTITPLTPMYEYTIYFNAAEGICR